MSASTVTGPRPLHRHDFSRRDFLKVLSGGVILPATGALGGCNFDVPEEAVSAWRAAPPPQTEIRRWALAHALLAPNPHNLQPWIVDLGTPRRIVLYYDPTRRLPDTDPYYRQLIIGCGAFVELLMQALAARGQAATLTTFPDGEYGPAPDARALAVVELTAGAVVADPLFEQIRRRRTHRMPFDTGRPLAAGVIETLCAASPHLPVGVKGTADAAAYEALNGLAAQAWETEVRTPAAMMESARLFRVGDDEILRHRDGITLTGFGVSLAKAFGAMRLEKMIDPSTSAFQRSLELGLEQARTARGWVWLMTPGNSRAQQLAAGRAYVRLHLKATELGIALHPMSQALQEYAQMADVQRRLYRTLGVDAGTHTVQMLARLGYATGAQPSPRRALEDLIKT